MELNVTECASHSLFEKIKQSCIFFEIMPELFVFIEEDLFLLAVIIHKT